jgi:hypothetical protein
LSERESGFGQAGAAAPDLIGPGGDGVASVVSANHSADGQQEEPEDQVRDRVRKHGGPPGSGAAVAVPGGRWRPVSAVAR